MGGIGWAQPPHEQGAESHAEHRQSRSQDTGGERQRLAGTGSPWPGALPGAAGLSWLPSEPSAELMAAPQGCSALAQLPRSGTQRAATAKSRLQVKLCISCTPSTSPALPRHRSWGTLDITQLMAHAQDSGTILCIPLSRTILCIPLSLQAYAQPSPVSEWQGHPPTAGQ